MATATPAWFDYRTYMANKVNQLNSLEDSKPDTDETKQDWSYNDVVNAFNASGFYGIEGAYNHFVAYGAEEEVSPNQYFNADQYYRLKTQEYYNRDSVDTITSAELQTVKKLIEDAGMNAWTHYDLYGSSEGVDPSLNFDSEAYCAAKAKIMNDNGILNGSAQWNAESMADAITGTGMSILEHFMTYRGTNAKEEVAKDFNPAPTTTSPTGAVSLAGVDMLDTGDIVA